MDLNSKTDLEQKIKTYEGLYEVLRDRLDKGNGCGLTSFYFLGVFHSNECGSITKVNWSDFGEESIKAAPPVMTDGEFALFMEDLIQKSGGDRHFSSGRSGMSHAVPIPPPHVLCARCKEGWTLEQSIAIESTSNPNEYFDLSPYQGKTLAEIGVILSKETDAIREYAGRISVFSEKNLVDTTTEAFRRQGPSGWKDTDRTHVAQVGESLMFFTYHFYHGPCFKELEEEVQLESAELMRAGLGEMFVAAGFYDVRVSKVNAPEHIITWLKEGLEIKDENAIHQELPYFKIETKQGTVGIFYGAYPMMDLEGSGVSPQEYAPGLVEEGLWFAPFPDTEDLLRLWQLLVKRTN